MAITKSIKGKVAVDPVSIPKFQGLYTFWTRKCLPWPLRKAHCFPSILALPVIIFPLGLIPISYYFPYVLPVWRFALKLCHSSCSASLKRKDTVHPTPTRLLSATALDHTDFSLSWPLGGLLGELIHLAGLAQNYFPILFFLSQNAFPITVTQLNLSLGTLCSFPWDLKAWIPPPKKIEWLVNTFELLWKLWFKPCSADLWSAPTAICRVYLSILASTQTNHKGSKITYKSAQKCHRSQTVVSGFYFFISVKILTTACKTDHIF